MREYLKENWKDMLSTLVISSAIAYGLDGIIPSYRFDAALMLCTPFVAIIVHFIDKRKEDPNSSKIITELDSIIGEQMQVIEEYERIFDSQLVELPCVCGGNTFQGLFSPNTENIVECEKCKNKYRVSVNYDSVMISEPLNVEQTFDELVGKTLIKTEI